MKDEREKREPDKELWIKKPLTRIVTMVGIVTISFSVGFITCQTKAWRKLPIITNIDDAISGDNYTLTISNVKKVLKPASDLTTIKYCYTDADTYENTKELFGKKIPFTTDKVVFTYDGTVSVGVDLAEVDYEIDNENKTIDITLPKLGIIANEIDTSSFKFPFISDSIFNSTDMSDYVKLVDQLKKAKGEKVLNDKEFMDSAKENTQTVLKSFLTSADATKQYTVNFK